MVIFNQYQIERCLNKVNEWEVMFLPEVNSNTTSEPISEDVEVIGDSPCPCCGYIIISNHGDALGYICPVCLWEIDLFIKSDDEPSDLNHGLCLQGARYNYEKYGAVLPSLKKHCRQPKPSEYP